MSSSSTSSNSSSHPNGLSVGNKHDFIVLDKFALRQFQSNNNNTSSSTSSSSVSTSATIQYDPVETTKRINDYYKEHSHGHLIDGYAPFCKHLFIPNFIPSLRCSYASITDQNMKYMHSDYIQRSAGELPVLTRWLDKEYVTGNEATHLDIILYSREQIYEENDAMSENIDTSTSSSDDAMESIGNSDVYLNGEWKWGIISIKPQEGNKELPMLPMTILRNSLGKSEGGSGVPVNREEYMKSVEFWKQHANVS